jgi:hypothetical protein
MHSLSLISVFTEITVYSAKVKRHSYFERLKNNFIGYRFPAARRRRLECDKAPPMRNHLRALSMFGTSFSPSKKRANASGVQNNKDFRPSCSSGTVTVRHARMSDLPTQS